MLPDFPENAKPLLTESPGTDGVSRLLTGELRALRDRDLASALDLLLRAITAKATLTDAVLETRVLRMVDPSPANDSLVCGMARELWSAGFRVTFGPSWEPVADADLVLGTGGPGSALERFICKGNLWETVSHHP